MSRKEYDLRINKDGDIVYHDDWDLQTVEKASLVAQDIKRILLFPIGALRYSRETGSELQHAINAPADPDLVRQEMLRVARDDDRIDQETIRVEMNAEGVPVLRFRVRGEPTQEVVLS